MNNAATSFPKPPGMGKEVAAYFEKIPRHPGRTGDDSEDILLNCRAELNNLIGGDDLSRIVLCKNSTEALNIAIHGMELKNDVVVTSALEHNSVLRPLYLLEKRRKIKLKIVPCDPEGRVIQEEWYRYLDENSPKLVILNHASNVTGAVNQVEQLLGFAKEKGCVTLLDASQSLGLINVNIANMEADLIAFTGHKYLLGPPGTGGLYVRKDIELEPFFVGGTGIRSDLKGMPPEIPQRLEAGTPAFPVFKGLLYSLRWQKKNPVDLESMELLNKKLERGLMELGANVIKVDGKRTFIISCTLPGWEHQEVGYILDKSFGIVCRTGLHCAPLIHGYIGTAPLGTIRFSISRFTTENDIDFALNIIETLMHETH